MVAGPQLNEGIPLHFQVSRETGDEPPEIKALPESRPYYQCRHMEVLKSVVGECFVVHPLNDTNPGHVGK